ncbi:MAG: oxidoreductase [Sphingomonadales bacterium]|nr:oxidoreductase [Sphingomonadales bacterium]
MRVLEQFGLAGRVAVVTGAGKGIGRGIALALAEAGADIVLGARTKLDLEETACQIEAVGARAHILPGDVTQNTYLDQLADAALAEFGKLSVWVNNAGGLPDATPRYLNRTTDEQWDAQFDLNLKAVWAGCRAAAGRMTEGGAIINLSSRAAFGGHKKNGAYSAAKAAVNSLTATLALELAPKIRVNAIAPGPIATPNFVESVGMTPTNANDIESHFQIPMQRFGTPADIGAATVFLASPAASWITGQCLYVTGGF